jgi:hypothetical protein
MFIKKVKRFLTLPSKSNSLKFDYPFHNFFPNPATPNRSNVTGNIVPGLGTGARVNTANGLL